MKRTAPWIAVISQALTLGCSGADGNANRPAAVGGNTVADGITGTAIGGSTDGNKNTGGTSGAAQTSHSGSAIVAGGTKSTISSAASGGSLNAGGSQNAGGSSSTGGVTASGGTNFDGGSSASTGTTNVGGRAPTGGSKSTGGSTNSGGASIGSLTAGGSKATGGSTGVAGASTGGVSSTGGTTSSNFSLPPMGWASWNSFAAKINYNVIKAQADAMVSSGLKTAGYQYINVDEGWWQGTRDSSGNITVDTSDWPGGMKAISDYIHGLGLKAGIYTDAGKDGCGYYYPTGRPAAPGSGSEGHYDQDFLQFSQWGFDFVKVDWCGGKQEGLDAKTAYQSISDAIKKATTQTGRPMVLSVCNWGEQSPWNWAPSMSTMWRTSADIVYYGDQPDMNRVFTNFDSAQHPTAQTPGHYNDPDMLIVGMSGFSGAQNRTHMALWAIAGAPLLAGNRLDTMNADTKSVLTNSEVIAIDQDPLAKQGVKVADNSGLQVYGKVLSGTNRRAVLLLNRTNSTGTITVRFADIDLGTTATVRNVWTATDLGTKTTNFAANVPSNDSVLLIVTGG